VLSVVKVCMHNSPTPVSSHSLSVNTRSASAVRLPHLKASEVASRQRHEGEGCALVCVSVYKSCIRAVSACTLGQMSVSRVHLLKQTAVALYMWPPFISVALETLRVLTHCVSELPIFTQPQTTYILARHTNALTGVHTHF